MAVAYLKDVATLRLAADKCTGCGFCVAVCPHQILAMDGGKIAVSDLDLCIECGACVINCPFNALSVDNTGCG